MAMDHKAFVFDADAYQAELRPVLDQSLRSGDSSPLRDFIQRHFDSLRDPYAGEPLEAEWERLLEVEDPQEYGDFALTKYYDPSDDIGLGRAWAEVQELLVRESEAGTLLTLGRTIGPPEAPFDPGRMGSYVMTNADAKDRLNSLKRLAQSKPVLARRLEPILRMYEAVARSGKGAYHTF
jgi:hypothetical protein